MKGRNILYRVVLRQGYSKGEEVVSLFKAEVTDGKRECECELYVSEFQFVLYSRCKAVRFQ